MKLVSILDLIQIGLPPVGKQIIVHEIRKSSGREYWSVGYPFESKKGRFYMGVEGTGTVISLSKNTRWISLPEEKLNAQGIEWYGKK